MIIECKSKVNPIKPASQLVNEIGKYLYKSLDGAYDMRKSVNTFDIFTVAYYQIPYLSTKPGGRTTYSDMQEMSFNLNLTTYSNKIRVNIIEVSPDEQTIGHFVVDPEKLQDVRFAEEYIMSKVNKQLNKYFEGYEFIF